MQSRAKIFLGLQPNKWILKELASHFHTNIALRSLPIQSEILGKATGKQTPGRDAKLVSCILIYAAILLKSLTRGAQALQWAAAPRCERGAQQSSYNSLASPTGEDSKISSLATTATWGFDWPPLHSHGQGILLHSVKGLESLLNLLSPGCLMLRDGPTERAAPVLTRSSSLPSFPHHLGHIYKEAH